MIARKTNHHNMLKGYNMHFLRLSPVPPCRPHLRERRACSQANFFLLVLKHFRKYILSRQLNCYGTRPP